MKKFEHGTYVGERALFSTHNASFVDCVFKDGESPLKESSDLDISKCSFEWKYPLWYCRNVVVKNSTILETARSGIWYTKNIRITDSEIASPKTFRRAAHIIVENCKLSNASETLWNCDHIRMQNVYVKGDYLGLNSSNVEIDNLHLDGNYCFDGGKNITIRNSVLNSKDSFWNSENVLIENCDIDGEYIAWNSKNLTFKNCRIKSHQGFCYIKGLKLINCELINCDLIFEYCEDIEIDVTSTIDSVKNPISGVIKSKGIKELIMEEDKIDPKKTKIYEI